MQPCVFFQTCDLLRGCRWQNAQISSPLGIGAAQFAGPFKAFFRCDDSDDLIDHSRRRNGSLHDFGTFRGRCVQNRNGDAGKHQRNPGVGEKGKTQMFLTVSGDFVMLAPK